MADRDRNGDQHSPFPPEFLPCTAYSRPRIIGRSASLALLLDTRTATLRGAPREVALRRPKLAAPGLPALATLDALPLTPPLAFHAPLLTPLLPCFPIAALLSPLTAPLDDCAPLLAPLLPRLAIAAALALLIRLPLAPAFGRCLPALSALFRSLLAPALCCSLPTLPPLFNTILSPLLTAFDPFLAPLLAAFRPLLASLATTVRPFFSPMFPPRGTNVVTVPAPV